MLPYSLTQMIFSNIHNLPAQYLTIFFIKLQHVNTKFHIITILQYINSIESLVYYFSYAVVFLQIVYEVVNHIAY